MKTVPQPTGDFTGVMPPKVRVNPEGFMNSATREHRVKKGKGSFSRKPKHKKRLDD